MQRKHSYGNQSSIISCYADGGEVKKPKGDLKGKPMVDKYIKEKKPMRNELPPPKKGRKYADGGEVKKPPKKAQPEMLGTGAARKAADKLKGRKKQLEQKEKELGI